MAKSKIKYDALTGVIKSKEGTTSIEQLIRDIYNINQYSAQLSRGITKNPYHPRNLGLSLDITAIVEREYTDVMRLYTTGEQSPTLAASLARLKRLSAKDIGRKRQERAFYTAVGKHYGVSYATAAKLAPQGKLASPVSMRGAKTNRAGSATKYKRWKDWVISADHEVSDDIYEAEYEDMLYLTQEININGEVPDEWKDM